MTAGGPHCLRSTCYQLHAGRIQMVEDVLSHRDSTAYSGPHFLSTAKRFTLDVSRA